MFYSALGILNPMLNMLEMGYIVVLHAMRKYRS